MSTRYRTVTLISGYLLLLVLAATPAAAQDSLEKLDSGLKTALRGHGARAKAARPGISTTAQEDGADRVNVIVRTRPGSRGAVRRKLSADGRNVKAEHRMIDAISMEVPVNALAGLANNPNVLSISIDANLTSSSTPTAARPPGQLEQPPS